MSLLPDPLQHRQAAYPIEEIFLRRWSPRAMSGAPVDQQTLNSLFEAARWAPSTYNEQEWRFLYAHRDKPHWDTYFNMLVEGNQAWCDKAGVLIVVLSKKTFTRNNKPNPVHSFDAGAAFENLALQGAMMGLVVHGMAGFNQSQARTELRIPDDYNTEAMIAIGHPGDPSTLPEGYQDLEKPSDRKPITEISCEGTFAL